MNAYRLLKPFIIERRWHILAGLGSLLIVDILQLVIPRIIKWAIDDITGPDSSGQGLMRYGLWIAGSAVVIGIFRYSWRFFIMGAARRAEEGLRDRLFRHIQKLPATFFDQRTTGDIMAHATNDMTSVRMALGMGLVGLTDTVVLGVAAVVFMAWISPSLTFFALLPMPLIALFTKILSRRLFTAYTDVQQTFSSLMEQTRERLAGIKVIKVFNREPVEAAAMESQSLNYIDTNMRLVRLRGVLFPMTIFLTNISVAIVVGLGGRGVIRQSISPGDFVAFISYLGLLTWPVMAVGWVASMIQRGKASLDRIAAILDAPEEPGREASQAIPETVNGEIRFDRVSFSHGPAEDPVPVLKDISFTVRPGEVLGIAGPPGSGKTSLVNLIPRIYDPTRGAVFVDGFPHTKIHTDTLRETVSFMPQEPFLFSGTIRENILFGNPDADTTEIDQAVAMAGLTDTLAGFPDGIQTVIGEKGILISGGQKQRLALARALIKPAPILILDDPVSQVDTQTAAHITRSLMSLKGRRTLIIISHRFSVFHSADQILVLKSGRIRETGTHDQLACGNGYYATANDMQQIMEKSRRTAL